MIAKVSTGRSFGGTIRYLHEGHRADGTHKGKVDKRAQLLDYNGIRPGMAEMIKDFDRHRWLNPDLGNAVGHISLSYHRQDTPKLSDAKMVQHARQLMTRLGMNPEETQFVLIRHHDCDHQHCHLVYNRVDYQGKTISDQFSKSRAKEAATTIARQEGLTVASEKKKEVRPTRIARLADHDQARYKIYVALGQELPKATSLAELTLALKSHQIDVIAQKGGQGLTFRLDSYSIKASLVDRSYSGYKIYQALEHNRVRKESLAIPPKQPASPERPAKKPLTIQGYTLTSQEKAQLLGGATLRLSLIGDDTKPYLADISREGDKIRVRRVVLPQTSASPAPEKPVTIQGYTLTSQEKAQLLGGTILRLQLIDDDTKPYLADVSREGNMIRIQRVQLAPVSAPAPSVPEKPLVIKGYTLTSQEKAQLLGGATLHLRLLDEAGKPFQANVVIEDRRIRIDRQTTPTKPAVVAARSTPPPSDEPEVPKALTPDDEKVMEPAIPPAWHAKALKEYKRLGGRILALQYNGFRVDPVQVKGKIVDYLLRPHGSSAKIAVKLSDLFASQPDDPKINKRPKLT